MFNVKKRIYSIYKITNTLTEKSYIGFDSNFPSRINTHIKDALKGKESPLCNDLRYYGNHIGLNNSFIFECIYQTQDAIHCLKIMEPYFIELYNSHYKYGNGYNMTFGGDGNLSENLIKNTFKFRKKLEKSLTKKKKLNNKKILSNLRKSKWRERRMLETTFTPLIKIPKKFLVT